jgi:hypothetical protein
VSTGRPPPGTIPTLTEVVSWPDSTELAEEAATAQSAAAAPLPPPPMAPPTTVSMTGPVPAPAVAAAPAPAAANPPPEAAAAASAPVPGPATAPAATRPATATAAATAADIQLTQRVLVDLQRQVELMLEVRLREALAPILARASDALVRDARKELTAAMRDIVSRSIARELGRREDR